VTVPLPLVEYTEMKQDDTLPVLIIECLDNYAPHDLSACTRVRLVGKLNGVNVIDRDLPDRPVDGKVYVVWEDGETAALGDLKIEIKAYSTGGVQTFPGGDEFITVRIVEDAL
jgi:hypothetical protein